MDLDFRELRIVIFTGRSNSTSKTSSSAGRSAHAVFFQIQLWDAASDIAEMANCDLSQVLQWANDKSIAADDGMDLTIEDMDEFFGGPVVPVKPITERLVI